jgi:hypothetical protein
MSEDTYQKLKRIDKIGAIIRTIGCVISMILQIVIFIKVY